MKRTWAKRHKQEKIRPGDNDQDTGAVLRDPGGRLSVAVVYPGSRKEGMTSLALHLLYRLVNQNPGTLAERIFWPGGGGQPRSVENGRPAQSFDLLAVTISAEEQEVLLPHLLGAAGLPTRAGERSGGPLVLAGGIAVRLNPLPLLPFVDLVVAGDAEPVLPAILRVLTDGAGEPKAALLSRLSGITGLGVPALGRGPFRAVFAADCAPAAQAVIEPETMFPGMFLVETGRGCPAGCRFCAVGFARRPPVFFSTEQVAQAAAPGLSRGLRIGLVGASLALHPELPALIERLATSGADLSPASLDPQMLASEAGQTFLESIARGGLRTITLAVETGSARLRRVINKAWSEDALEIAVTRLGAAGILNLKLYFMFGLPTEEDADLEDSIALASHVQSWLHRSHRGRGRTGHTTVSINPFVPKPHTPFAREAMPGHGELKRRQRLLMEGMRRLGGISVSGASPRASLLQCYLDRADGSASALLEKTGGSWPPSPGLLHEVAPGWEQLVCRSWPGDVTPPWTSVDTGVESGYLTRECQEGLALRFTPACQPVSCRACGACPP